MAANRLQTLFGHLNGHPIQPSQTSASGSATQVVGGPYKYTVDAPKLTREQRDFYEKNGFIVVRKLVSPEKLERYRDRFASICKGEIRVPGMTVMKDISIAKSEFVQGEKAITKIQDFHADDVLFEYCALPEVVEYVENFTGPDVVAVHTMLINKPPDSGKLTSRHPMHQDLHYFPFRPAETIVCSWTAMQKVNRQNGCLVVVPGTHTGTLQVHEYPKWEGGVNKMYHGIQDYNPNQPRVHLEMDVGDTVFFHPLLIHGSGTNRTDGFRKSISCHFASGNSYFTDISKTTQSVIADEILEVVQRKFGKNHGITIEDVWRFKSRSIKGNNNFNA